MCSVWFSCCFNYNATFQECYMYSVSIKWYGKKLFLFVTAVLGCFFVQFMKAAIKVT